MRDPLCQTPNKSGTDPEFACNIIDGVVPPRQFLLYLFNNDAQLLIIGYRDIKKVGEISQVALEIRPELIVCRTEFLHRAFSRLWHPPLFFNEIALFQDADAVTYPLFLQMSTQLLFGHP